MKDRTSSASRPVMASGTTGSVCQKTGPYVYDNGFLKFVVIVKKGDAFPSAPTQTAPVGGAKTQTQSQPTNTWSMVSN